MGRRAGSRGRRAVRGGRSASLVGLTSGASWRPRWWRPGGPREAWDAAVRAVRAGAAVGGVAPRDRDGRGRAGDSAAGGVRVPACRLLDPADAGPRRRCPSPDPGAAAGGGRPRSPSRASRFHGRAGCRAGGPPRPRPPGGDGRRRAAEPRQPPPGATAARADRPPPGRAPSRGPAAHRPARPRSGPGRTRPSTGGRRRRARTRRTATAAGAARRSRRSRGGRVSDGGHRRPRVPDPDESTRAPGRCRPAAGPEAAGAGGVGGAGGRPVPVPRKTAPGMPPRTTPAGPTRSRPGSGRPHR